MTNATVPPIKGYSMAGAAEPPAPSPNDTTTHSRDLCAMTRTQLLELAAQHGIECRSNIRKPLLIEMLEEAGV